MSIRTLSYGARLLNRTVAARPIDPALVQLYH